MFVHTLEGRNFRGLPDFCLHCHARLNVFTGANGSGKSGLLRFLTLMLARCSVLTEGDLAPDEADIANGCEQFWGRLRCRHGYSWLLAEQHFGRQMVSRSFENCSGSFEDVPAGPGPLAGLRAALDAGDSTFAGSFPLVVSCLADRGLADCTAGPGAALSPQAALEGALGAWPEVSVLAAPFRLSARAQSLDRGASDSCPMAGEAERQVRAINRALQGVVPELGGLHVLQDPFRLVVRKGQRTVGLAQLSEAERRLLALPGDLARRLALANPALANPLEGEGVVIIDDLDLHLHPAWQGRLVPRLMATFPNCQFFVATHSPLVLGSVRAESIWVLHDNGQPCHPQRSFGMEASELLGEIMETESRPAAVTAALENIDFLVDTDRFDEARAALRALAAQTGEIPALHGARAWLAMMEPQKKEDG